MRGQWLVATVRGSLRVGNGSRLGVMVRGQRIVGNGSRFALNVSRFIDHAYRFAVRDSL